MARRGRPRKAGKRAEAGRLVRELSYDKGNDRVQQMQARFGTFYSSALGRAFAAGLLGEPDQALGRYQAARRFIKLHARFYGAPGYTCPLDASPRGANDDPWPDYERNKRQLAWLNAAIDSMDVSGDRRFFDQLVSTENTDAGPPWMDILLAGGTDPLCFMALNAAIRALDVIAPEAQPARILAVVS